MLLRMAPIRRMRRRRRNGTSRGRVGRSRGDRASGLSTGVTSRLCPERRSRPPSPRRWGRCRAKPDGWGVVCRSTCSKIRAAVRATLPASKKRPTPHPARRATFPSKAGEGKHTRRREMCAYRPRAEHEGKHLLPFWEHGFLETSGSSPGDFRDFVERRAGARMPITTGSA
jgi:hypothetical protein